MSDIQTITEQAARDARDVFESYGSKAREAIDYMEQLIYAAMRKTEPATDAAHVNETLKSEHDAGNVLTYAAQARAEALKEAAAVCRIMSQGVTHYGPEPYHTCEASILALIDRGK